MITGFERETHKLTDEECRMIKPMVNGLKDHVGKNNPVTSNEIMAGMKKIGFKINGARVRKLINFIRVTKRVPNLIATSFGYYIATSPAELEKYKRSLDERISAIKMVRESFN